MVCPSLYSLLTYSLNDDDVPITKKVALIFSSLRISNTLGVVV